MVCASFISAALTFSLLLHCIFVVHNQMHTFLSHAHELNISHIVTYAYSRSLNLQFTGGFCCAQLCAHVSDTCTLIKFITYCHLHIIVSLGSTIYWIRDNSDSTYPKAECFVANICAANITIHNCCYSGTRERWKPRPSTQLCVPPVGWSLRYKTCDLSKVYESTYKPHTPKAVKGKLLPPIVERKQKLSETQS